MLHNLLKDLSGLRFITKTNFTDRFYKLLFFGASLFLISWLFFYWRDNDNYHFYNNWLELAQECPPGIIFAVLWLWFVWQLPNGKGKIKITKWVVESLLALLIISSLWTLLNQVTTISEGKGLRDNYNIPYQEVLRQRAGPAGSRIFLMFQPERFFPLVDGVQFVRIRKPVNKWFYTEEDISNSDVHKLDRNVREIIYDMCGQVVRGE